MTATRLHQTLRLPVRPAVCSLLLFGGWLVAAGSLAEASVKRHTYAGGFVTNFGFPAVCTLSFSGDGVLTQWEYGILFGGTYIGPFTEVEAAGVTYWESVVPDESPNGYATFSGVSFFGLVTSFHNQNLDQLITADGWLIRTGSTP
ncbi:MAG TPA: hypothetical protein VFG20_20080 [Planctomycetaceae bacterium]|nr:hypothetical protein [Planctomycetaceae bacterium]